MRITLKDILGIGLAATLAVGAISYVSNPEIYADRNKDGVVSGEEWKQVSNELESVLRNMNSFSYIPSGR